MYESCFKICLKNFKLASLIWIVYYTLFHRAYGKPCDPDEFDCSKWNDDIIIFPNTKRETYERNSQIGIMVLAGINLFLEIVQLYRVSLLAFLFNKCEIDLIQQAVYLTQLFETFKNEFEKRFVMTDWRCSQTGRRYMQWTNFFDWLTYIFSLLLVVDIREGANSTGAREVKWCSSFKVSSLNNIF